MSGIASSWFYMNGQERIGPVSQFELCDLFRRGVLNLQTMVWSEAFKNWAPASSIAALRSLVPQAPLATPLAMPGLPGQSATLNYETPSTLDGPVGIGGWLILPAIGLVLTPIGIVLGVLAMTVLLTKFQSAVPIDASAIKKLLVVDVLYGLYIVATAIMFFSKKRIAPSMMIGGYIAAIVLAIVAGVVAQPTSPNPAPASAQWAGLIKPIIVALIWIPYFRISKRVKNTFVN